MPTRFEDAARPSTPPAGTPVGTPGHDAADPRAHGPETGPPGTAAAIPEQPADLTRRFEHEALVHLDTLYAVGLHLTHGDRADAETLVEETYVRAYRAYAQLRRGVDLGAYLLRTQREVWRDTHPSRPLSA